MKLEAGLQVTGVMTSPAEAPVPMTPRPDLEDARAALAFRQPFNAEIEMINGRLAMALAASTRSSTSPADAGNWLAELQKMTLRLERLERKFERGLPALKPTVRQNSRIESTRNAIAMLRGRLEQARLKLEEMSGWAAS